MFHEVCVQSLPLTAASVRYTDARTRTKWTNTHTHVRTPRFTRCAHTHTIYTEYSSDRSESILSSTFFVSYVVFATPTPIRKVCLARFLRHLITFFRSHTARLRNADAYRLFQLAFFRTNSSSVTIAYRVLFVVVGLSCDVVVDHSRARAQRERSTHTII